MKRLSWLAPAIAVALMRLVSPGVARAVGAVNRSLPKCILAHNELIFAEVEVAKLASSGAPQALVVAFRTYVQRARQSFLKCMGTVNDAEGLRHYQEGLPAKVAAVTTLEQIKRALD